MFGFERTEYDAEVYEKYLADFLPEKFIDTHVHIYKEAMRPVKKDPGVQMWPKMVAAELTIEDLEQTLKDMFPGKTVLPVLMTDPCADLAAGNRYALECAGKTHLPVLYCTTPETTPEEIREAVLNKGCKGIKPYLNHAPEYIPADEIRIYDFLTREQLETVDELGAVAVLHIARPGRLRDKVNLAQMTEIDSDFPNAKVQIAHIGRAYSPEDLEGAFEVLKDTKHLLFDFTANTLDLAMEECIKAVGPERVMFGSDLPITKMRMRRISENGNYINIVPEGLYGDISGDRHMRNAQPGEKISNFMYEELKAFRRAAEHLALSRGEIEDIMLHNAERVYGPFPKN